MLRDNWKSCERESSEYWIRIRAYDWIKFSDLE